jgi:hypothetical protein
VARRTTAGIKIDSFGRWGCSRVTIAGKSTLATTPQATNAMVMMTERIVKSSQLFSYLHHNIYDTYSQGLSLTLPPEVLGQRADSNDSAESHVSFISRQWPLQTPEPAVNKPQSSPTDRTSLSGFRLAGDCLWVGYGDECTMPVRSGRTWPTG